jgi:hypothetical protein
MSHDTDAERIRDWCQSIANKDVNRFVELLRDELFTDHEIARIIECMENCCNHCYDAPNTRAHHCTLKKIDLGIDYRETDGTFWPESEYECIWNELDETWLTRREEDGVELYHYKAETLDKLTDLIQEDLELDSTVYDIFNCYIEEWREFED